MNQSYAEKWAKDRPKSYYKFGLTQYPKQLYSSDIRNLIYDTFRMTLISYQTQQYR